MKKLKLKELAVESFATSEEPREHGTVQANAEVLLDDTSECITPTCPPSWPNPWTACPNVSACKHASAECTVDLC